MAVIVSTPNPVGLLTAINNAIKRKRVVTWSYDTDGDFTHTAEQWKNRAWLRPRVEEDRRLILNIVAPRETTLSTTTYAIYHGRFIEMLLSHFDGEFTRISATALPTSNDSVRG
jgi:hypothetical protein